MSGRSSAKALLAARSSYDWVFRELEAYAAGVHALAEPAYVLDSEIGETLAELYRRHDGVELFHESLVLFPSRQIRACDGVWTIGHVDGEEISMTTDGRVWLKEHDLGERLVEGSSVDRWLVGQVAAFGLLYDHQGEFRDDVLDEYGELTADSASHWHRTVIDRDRFAAAPRWRLARGLAQQSEPVRARQCLEEAVALEPTFSWAWYDLGRTAEAIGEDESAYDEFSEAAAVAGDGGYAGFFWAQAARVARRRGWEERRLSAAGSALSVAPMLASDQLEGARELLGAGDRDGAIELAQTAAALAPTNLDVLALLRALNQ